MLFRSVLLECLEESLPKRFSGRKAIAVSGKHLCRRCRLYDTGVSCKTRTVDGRCTVLLLSDWTRRLSDERNFPDQDKADGGDIGGKHSKTARGPCHMEPSNPERLSVRIYFEFGPDSGAAKRAAKRGNGFI